MGKILNLIFRNIFGIFEKILSPNPSAPLPSPSYSTCEVSCEVSFDRKFDTKFRMGLQYVLQNLTFLSENFDQKLALMTSEDEKRGKM